MNLLDTAGSPVLFVWVFYLSGMILRVLANGEVFGADFTELLTAVDIDAAKSIVCNCPLHER